MTTRNKSDILVFTYIFVWLGLCTRCCLSDSSTCQKWADIAKTMSSKAGEVTCTNNATSICTRYDCEGSEIERLSSVIEIDYCFGIQLNSCHDPLSLDFYLKIPSHNMSAQYRITHDQIVYLTDLGIPEVKNLPIKPLLDFELERDGTDSVLVSVTFKVRSSIGAIYFDQYEQNIIDEVKLPLLPCSGPLTMDPSDKPADDFMSAPCHPNKYPTPTSGPKVITPARHNDKPSETFNKACDFIHGCSKGETCQMTSEGKGTCVCEPDYTYSQEQNVCVSQGSVGIACSLDGDCGIYEKCHRDMTKSTTSNHFSCQCEDGFSWDEMRRLCVHKQPHSHSTDDDHKHHTPSPQKSTTTTTTTVMPSNNTSVDTQKHKASSSNTKYIIIAASAVGGVILIAVVVVGLLLCRHRRRNQSSGTSGGLYDSSDTPMLADTDDDVDMVM